MAKRPHLKDCPKCGKRAGCIDTRALNDGRIRRRYRCPCKNRWSSIETILPTIKNNHSTKLADAMMRDSVRRDLQGDLRKLLGVDIRVPMEVTKRTHGRKKLNAVDIDRVYRAKR